MVAPERWLKRGWRAFVLNAGAFVGAALIVALAAAIPFGLMLGGFCCHGITLPLALGAPFSAALLLMPLGMGLLEMALRAQRGEAVGAWEVLHGFRFFGPGLLLWFAGVVAGLTVTACSFLPLVGAVVGVIAAPLLTLFANLAALCVIDRGAGVREALGRTLLVVERNWLGLWAVSFLFLALQQLGSLVLGIGWLVTVPWITCAWAAAYQDLFERP